MARIGRPARRRGCVIVATAWEPNEEKDADDELTETLPDQPAPLVTPEDEQGVEVTGGDPRSALDALGEDVASSPARRGHEDPELAARTEEDQPPAQRA